MAKKKRQGCQVISSIIQEKGTNTDLILIIMEFHNRRGCQFGNIKIKNNQEEISIPGTVHVTITKKKNGKGSAFPHSYPLTESTPLPPPRTRTRTHTHTRAHTHSECPWELVTTHYPTMGGKNIQKTYSGKNGKSRPEAVKIKKK